MTNLQPIGFFDSGVGGTSIWKVVNKLLSGESTIYLADSKNAPYGERSREEIIALSKKNTDFLLAAGCKLIVVACNTATTNAIQDLRSHYAVPFIGIEPAIKPAAIQTRTKAIGVLATRGTLSSNLFSKTADSYSEGIVVVEQVGEGLVTLIEQGKMDSPEMETLLKRYLHPMLQQNIDYLVLGCTHYFYIIPQLQKILPPSVQIIDSGDAVARQTKAVLEQTNLLNPAKSVATHQFYTNLDEKLLAHFLRDVKSPISVRYRDF